jgi:hypothetical protein
VPSLARTGCRCRWSRRRLRRSGARAWSAGASSTPRRRSETAPAWTCGSVSGRAAISLMVEPCSDCTKSRFSSPGRPNTYSTPTFSSARTRRSDALVFAMPQLSSICSGFTCRWPTLHAGSAPETGYSPALPASRRTAARNLKAWTNGMRHGRRSGRSRGNSFDHTLTLYHIQILCRMGDGIPSRKSTQENTDDDQRF